MNPDQQAFHDFMLASVQPGQESAMEAVLQQTFAQQNAGAFGAAQLQAVVPQMTTMLRPECVVAFDQYVATWAAQSGGAAPAVPPVAVPSVAPIMPPPLAPVAPVPPVAPLTPVPPLAPFTPVPPLEPVPQFEPVPPVVQPVMVQPVVQQVPCCQSCGIPFETPGMQAMEMTGAPSPYCTGCYGGGRLPNPTATVAGMVAMGVARLTHSMGEQRAHEYMNRVVPNLGRWRR